jgi:hypothetical protein
MTKLTRWELRLQDGHLTYATSATLHTSVQMATELSCAQFVAFEGLTVRAATIAAATHVWTKEVPTDD